MMEKRLLLKMQGITKFFGAVRALYKVNLTLSHGEILGLVGDNGAGKSTLMQIISGVYPAEEGGIFLEGEKVRIINPRIARDKGIGMIYQDLALVDNITIWENIFLGNEIEKPYLKLVRLIDKKRMQNRSLELLKKLKVDIDSSETKVRYLSGGQRAAVAIARSLAFIPKIVIMDEPTAALAVKEVNEVLNLTLELKKSGVSIIIISHRLQDIFAIADRIMVLRRGIKVGDNKIEEVSSDDIVKLIVGADLATTTRKEIIAGR
jgi:simple sugar transport system ATP-binding protein